MIRLRGLVLLALLAATVLGCGGGESGGSGSTATVPADAPPAVTLGAVEDLVATAVAAGEMPVVVFDLDGTLFHNGTRTKQIWLDAARRARAEHPDLQWKLESLDPLALPYRVKSALPGLGVTDPDEQGLLMDAWVAGFFSDDYLLHDVPLEGAAAYVTRLRDMGAIVVYLTGRDAPRMLVGTTASLRETGFPMGVYATELIMKPEAAVEDSLFKVGVFDYLDHLGRVVGVFENEPGNLNALHDRFPGAVAVFVETNHRPEAPPVNPALPRVRDFRKTP